MTNHPDHHDLARLLRWEDAGGAWQVVHQTDASVTLALLTCDGGTVMERLTTRAAVVRAHVAGRDES